MKPDLQKEFGTRLCRLANGAMGLRMMLPIEAKAMDGADPVLLITASDATLDRYDEVIDPNGWDLKNYNRNPVIVNSHQYWDISFLLGKALKTEVKDGKLTQQVLFAVDINPLAKMAYELYRGKFLNAFSVGFSPIEWTNGTTGSGYARKYNKQELLENSAVIVPANPNALQDALDEGAISKGMLRDAADQLRKILSTNESAKPPTEPGASGQGLDVAQLKQLSTQARAIVELTRKNA